jgi:hypothetical protein
VLYSRTRTFLHVAADWKQLCNQPQVLYTSKLHKDLYKFGQPRVGSVGHLFLYKDITLQFASVVEISLNGMINSTVTFVTKYG